MKKDSKMPTTSNAVIGMIQVIAAAICWGTLGIFSTYLSKLGFTGWQISTLRIVTATALLLVLLPSLLPSLKQLNRTHWLILSVQSIVGVLGMTVCFFFCGYLFRRGDGGRAALYRPCV